MAIARSPDWVSAFHSLSREYGFPLSGHVDWQLAQTSYTEHFERYAQWIAAGNAGEMTYLERGLDRRRSPVNVFAPTQSIFVVARPYSAAKLQGRGVDAERPQYARYLRGSDYHDHLSHDLKEICATLGAAYPDTHLETKVCVDTSAVLERTWAELCGIGWIGKNTLLIHPEWGSYFLLGVVLVNQSTGRGPQIHPDYCGSCSRCIEGCPTKALSVDSGMSAQKCISYSTLEARKSAPAAPHEGWIAGCDICQEVCPFNLRVTKRTLGIPPAEFRYALSWQELEAESPESFAIRVRDGALSRIKPTQQSKNLLPSIRSHRQQKS